MNRFRFSGEATRQCAWPEHHQILFALCVLVYTQVKCQSQRICVKTNWVGVNGILQSSIRHEISQNAINLWIVVLQLSKNIHNNAAPTDDSAVLCMDDANVWVFVGEFNCDHSIHVVGIIQSFHWYRKCSSFSSFYVHSYVVRDECEHREWIDNEYLLLEKSSSKIGGQKSTCTH